MLPSCWEIFFMINTLFFFSRPQSLKNEPKEERQPKATQPCPAAEENREDDKRHKGELAAERGNGLCSLLAEDVVAALRHHQVQSCPRTVLGAECLQSPEQTLG